MSFSPPLESLLVKNVLPFGVRPRFHERVCEVGSGAAKREAREKLLEAARRREIDVVLVWRLDRWGRSVPDLQRNGQRDISRHTQQGRSI